MTHLAFVGGGYDDFQNHVIFHGAWNNPIDEDKEKWRTAIRNEFLYMIKNKVWRRHCKDNILSNRRLIGHKWVFKVKGNGVFRARLCAIGYSQVAGVDFTSNFVSELSKVMGDTTESHLKDLFWPIKYILNTS